MLAKVLIPCFQFTACIALLGLAFQFRNVLVVILSLVAKGAHECVATRRKSREDKGSVLRGDVSRGFRATEFKRMSSFI